MKISTRLCALIAVAITAAPVSSRAAAALQSRPVPVRLHVVDRGIGQPYRDGLRVGDPFQTGHRPLYPELPEAGRILLPMPGDDELTESAMEDLVAGAAESLKQRIAQGMRQGVTEFEIQLVQNVGVGRYLTRQDLAKRFGEMAYKAIGEVVADLTTAGADPSVDLTLGSNGAVAFTENVESWIAYVERISQVTLIDGRAWIAAAARSIEALGQNKVRIFNTLHDIWAPPASIGYARATRLLKRLYPGITALLLEPLDDRPAAQRKGFAFFRSHISSMNRLDGRFRVREIHFDGLHLRMLRLGELTGGELRGSDSHALRRSQALRRRDFESQADRLADSMERLAGNLELLEALVGLLEDAELIAGLPPGFPLLRAWLHDKADELRGGKRSLAASHLLEELGKIGLSQVPNFLDFLIKSGRLPKAYRGFPGLFGLEDFVAGATSHLAKGRMGIEELTNYLDGFSKLTVSIAAGLLAFSVAAPFLGPEAAREIAGRAAVRMASTVGHLQVLGRAVTRNWFAKWAKRPIQKEILRQWGTAQKRRLADGLPMLSLRSMFTEEDLEEAGFEPESVEAWDRDIAWKNAMLQGRPEGWAREGGPELRVDVAIVDGEPVVDLSLVGFVPALESYYGPAPAQDAAAETPPKRADEERSRSDETGESDSEERPCRTGEPLSADDARPPCGAGPGDSDDLPPLDLCPDGTFPPCDKLEGDGDDDYCPDGSRPPCEPPPEGAAESERSPTTEEPGSNPESVESWLYGYAALASGAYREANAAFAELPAEASREILDWARRFTAANPEAWLGWVLLADAKARLGDYSGAAQDLRTAGRLSPPDALLHDLAGIVQALAGNLEGAQRELEDAMRIEPDFLDAVVNRAIVRLLRGDLSAAERSLSGVLRLDPEHTVALNARAVSRSLLGRWEEAKSDFEAARRLTGVPGPAYLSDNQRLMEWARIQSSFNRSELPPSPLAARADRRGGVLMGARVERNPRADFSGMFGSAQPPAAPLPEFFLTPFAVFAGIAGSPLVGGAAR